MKRLQMKFVLYICASFLSLSQLTDLVTQVEAKRDCKPGQEDVVFQPFDLKVQGM
jgi:hypothetical protein